MKNYSIASQTFYDRFLLLSLQGLRKSLLISSALVLTAGGSAKASTYIWDAGGASPTNPADGSGTWDNSTANFSNGTTDGLGPIAPLTTTTTAATASGGNTVTLTSVAGLSTGEILSSSAFAAGTTILSITGDIVTLSSNATAAISNATSISFAPPNTTVTFGNNNGTAGTITVAAGGEGGTALVLKPTSTGSYTFTGGNVTIVSSNTVATPALTVQSSATFLDNLDILGLLSQISFTAAGQTLTLDGTGANILSNSIGGSTAAIAASSLIVLNGGSTATYTGSGSTSNISFNVGDPGVIGINPGTATPTSGVYLLSGTLNTSGQPSTIGGAAGGLAAAGLMTVGGGTLNATIGLAIGQSGGLSQSSRLVINSGTVNAGYLYMDFNTTTGSNDELDVNGGVLNVTTALALQAWNLTGGQSVVDITGGTTTLGGLDLNHYGPTGVAALGGSSVVKLEGGTLYIGEGGIINGGQGTSTYALNFLGGTLAASSDWTSSLNMSLANTLTIQAANASAGAQKIVLSGALTGTGNIIKTGAGSLKLSGANNYSGTTAVNAGTLQFANETSFYNGIINGTTAGEVSVAAGATLDLSVGGAGEFTNGDVSNIVGGSSFATGSTLALDTTDGNLLLSNSLTGAYGLTKLGTDTLILTGTNSYVGATTINGGTLDLGGSTANGSIVSGSPLILAGGTLNYTVTGGATQTFGSLILNAGASSINAAAGDTVALGAITRNAGSTIDFSSTGTFTTTTTTNTNGILGGYATVGGNTWAVAPSTSGGAITGLSTYETTAAAGTTASNYANANIDVTSSTGTIAGVITPNTFRFNQAAADTVTLATGNNIVGAGGILVTSNVGANGSTISGGTLEGSSGGNLIIDQNDALGSLTIASIIANNGTATGLVKSGSGTLILSGANTYTGATVLNGGVVVLNSAVALSTAANAAINGISFDGGSIKYGSSITTDYSAAIKNSTGAISVDLNGNTVTWATSLAASNTGGLTVYDTSASGSGTLILSSTAGNLFSGNISIIAGTLQTNSFSTTQPALGSGTNAILLGDTTTGNSHNATLYLSTSGPNPANDIVVEAGSSGVLSIVAGGPMGFTGAVALNNNLTVDNTGGTSRVTVFTNTVTEGAGALTITKGTGVGGVRFDGDIVVGSGGLILVNKSATGDGNLGAAGGITGTGNLVLNNTTSLANGITLSSNSINNSGTILNSSTGTGSVLISASVGSNVTGVIQNSADTLILSGANTYTGTTTVSAGTLVLQNVAAQNSFNTVFVGSGATLDIQNVAETLAGLNNISASGGVVTDTTGNTVRILTLGGSGNYLFGGVITATTLADMSLTVALTGGGSQTLSGANTYTGATAVNLGTLALSGTGSLAGTAVIVGKSIIVSNVSGNATLLIEGNNTIGNGNAGTLNVIGGDGTSTGQGTLSLVSGTINTLTLSNTNAATAALTLGTAGTGKSAILDLEVGATSDEIAIAAGKLLTSGAVTINITGLGNLTGTQQTLISAAANSGTAFVIGSTGFSLGTTTGNFGGYVVSLANDSTTAGHDLYLNETLNTTALPTTAAYWYGGASAVTAQGGTTAWNNFVNGNTDTSNFTTDAGGTTNATGLIGASTNVTFDASANVVSGSDTNTTLGQNFTINSLTFNAANVGIASGAGTNVLTINAGTAGGNTSGNGITVASNVGADTISANLVLGSSQTWTVNSNDTLTASGDVGGASALTKAGAGTVVLASNTGNDYSGGTSVTAGRLLVTNSSGSGTGYGAVSVSGSTAILGGSGKISGPVTVSSGGNLYSGAIPSFTTSGPGAGAVNGTSGGLSLTSTLAVNGGSLTFALANDSTLSYTSPAMTTSYLNLGTTGSVSFSGADTINLVDLTSGELSLRSGMPYLLISAASNSMFNDLVTMDASGNLALDGNGTVLGVWAGGSNPLTDYTAVTFNQYASDGTMPLTGSAYDDLYLILNNGQLEVAAVPEPGTWALMFGGLMLLVFVQWKRRQV